jgi:hypothetical protein
MGLITNSIQLSGDTYTSPTIDLIRLEGEIDTQGSGTYSTALTTEGAVVSYVGLTLSTTISTEESVRSSSDTSLSTAISTANSTRSGADTSLSTAISTANSTRSSADSSLATAINVNSGGYLSGLTDVTITSLSAGDILVYTGGTWKNQTTLNADGYYLNISGGTVYGKMTYNSTYAITGSNDIVHRNYVDTGDTSLSTAIANINVTGVTSLSTALSSEISTRGSVDTSLSTAISTANSTRSSADTSLSTAISTTNSTVSSADSSLSTSINNLSVAPSKFIYGSNGSGSNTANATQNLLELPQYKSGFWEVNGAAWTPNANWFWCLTMAHTSNTSTYNYSTQIISDYTNAGYLYTRTISGGASPSASSWYKIWTEANDGSSSGLDADLWDGNQFATYLNQAVLTSSSPTFAGLTVNGTSTLDAISLGGTITPESTNTYALGSSTRLFSNTYSTKFIGANGSSSAPSFSFASYTGYGLFAASGYIGITFASSTDYFRFTSAGVFHAESDIIAYSSTVPSDNRLKENVKNIDSGLSIIDQLNPVSFTWKDPKKSSIGTVYGLIAQDVEKVLPEIVKEHNLLGKPEDEMYKTVNYEQIIPFLIKSIKELKEEIDILKNKK